MSFSLFLCLISSVPKCSLTGECAQRMVTVTDRVEDDLKLEFNDFFWYCMSGPRCVGLSEWLEKAVVGYNLVVKGSKEQLSAVVI